MDSNKPEDGGRRAETGDWKPDAIDRAIDLAVRQMLDVEPRADLRARVIERIEHPRRAFNWIWVMAPIGAAAVVVLAVILGQSQKPLPARAMTAIVVRPSDARLPPAIAHLEVPRKAPERVRTVTPRDRLAQATLASADDTMFGITPPPGFAVVQALTPPAPILVATISPPPPSGPVDLDIEPLRLAPLELNALPETPHERQE